MARVPCVCQQLPPRRTGGSNLTAVKCHSSIVVLTPFFVASARTTEAAAASWAATAHGLVERDRRVIDTPLGRPNHQFTQLGVHMVAVDHTGFDCPPKLDGARRWLGCRGLVLPVGSERCKCVPSDPGTPVTGF